MDLVGSSLALLVLFPILLFAAMRIRRFDGGPIYYRAPRIGRKGAPFKMLKFRTMVLNADKIGGSSTSDDDPRITPVGKWMRRWKIDELPQFINVLKGDMSIVGPRPQVAWAVNQYTAEEKKVLNVRPGITDWASLAFSNEGEILRGYKDADAAYMELIHPHKMKLALKYVQTQSILTDLRIIWMTIRSILGHRPTLEELEAK